MEVRAAQKSIAPTNHPTMTGGLPEAERNQREAFYKRSQAASKRIFESMALEMLYRDQVFASYNLEWSNLGPLTRKVPKAEPSVAWQTKAKRLSLSHGEHGV